MIPVGDDAAAIGEVLQDRGIIADAGRWSGYVKAQSEGSEFKAGTYTFQAGTGYSTIIARLDAGPAAGYARLLVPEGFRLTDIEARLGQIGISPSGYAAAARAAVPPPGFGHHANMEGFMFPATYQVRPHEAPSTLVSQQLAAFRAAFAQVN
ncbi:MAG: endolytic transglycosylase MltG, partial [Gaiellales bacterium]